MNNTETRYPYQRKAQRNKPNKNRGFDRNNQSSASNYSALGTDTKATDFASYWDSKKKTRTNNNNNSNRNRQTTGNYVPKATNDFQNNRPTNQNKFQRNNNSSNKTNYTRERNQSKTNRENDTHSTETGYRQDKKFPQRFTTKYNNRTESKHNFQQQNKINTDISNAPTQTNAKKGFFTRITEKITSSHQSKQLMSQGQRITTRTRGSDELTLCTLSGTNEIGRNCSFIEYKGDIIIIDAGLSFPEQELYGIDYLIPNVQYLKKNRDRIKAILITHGHLDHTGALPYLLPDLDFPPVYAGRFANALIKEKLIEFKIDNRVKQIDVDRSTDIHIGNFHIQFIGVTHSIPNAFSIFIETAGGNVFFSGDYKIDQDPANEPESDYARLKSLQGRVDLALMESTKANAPGKAKSETEIAQNISEIIKNHNGRVIVASFSSLVSRIYSVLKIAQSTNRKVYVSGRSLLTALKIASAQGYVSLPNNLIVDDKKVKDIQDNQLLILCTGSQGEKNAALSRIALGEHKSIKIKKGDLVILSSSEIPDNIVAIQHMTDKLIQQGAEIIKNDMMEVHESGHGLIEDIKLMYDMLRPKYVMPIHGWLTLRYQNKQNFVRWGMNPDNVLLTEDGQTWIHKNNKWNNGKIIPSKPILIDGLGVGDVGDVVIKDRQQLAEYGVLCIIMNLHNKTKQLIGKPVFFSKGFVYMKNSQELLKELTNMVNDIHRNWISKPSEKGKLDTIKLKAEIEITLQKYILKKIEREPVIMVYCI